MSSMSSNPSPSGSTRFAGFFEQLALVRDKNIGAVPVVLCSLPLECIAANMAMEECSILELWALDKCCPLSESDRPLMSRPTPDGSSEEVTTQVLYFGFVCPDGPADPAGPCSFHRCVHDGLESPIPVIPRSVLPEGGCLDVFVLRTSSAKPVTGDYGNS